MGFCFIISNILIVSSAKQLPTNSQQCHVYLLAYFSIGSNQMFKSTLEKYKQPEPDGSADVGADRSMIVTDQVLADNKDRTNRNLRTRDLIWEKSQSAALIVV